MPKKKDRGGEYREKLLVTGKERESELTKERGNKIKKDVQKELPPSV